MHTDSKFSLMLPYRTELLNVVTTFIVELGQSLGATEQETLHLRLAAEEVFLYIMEAFPSSEKDAVFYLKCEENSGNVKYSFSNHGTPINVRSTPEFAVTDIEATIEGLGLSLIKQVTDSFECINCGNDGWLIVFSKQFSSFRSILQQEELSNESALNSQCDLDLHVTRATAAHVTQLIDLIYNTYRYSYALSDLYDEHIFRKKIEDKHIISLIVETSERKVIGNCMISFASSGTAEIGSLMTNPHYRTTGAAALLVKELLQVLRDTAFKNILFYAKPVTTHTNSQRLMNVCKFAPVGFQLSLCDSLRFLGINEDIVQRESCVFAVLTTRLVGSTLTVHAPPEHRQIIDKLLTNTGISITWAIEEATATLPPCTRITNTPTAKMLLMETQVAEFGLDFTAILKKETLSMQQNGFLTCILTFPLDKPLPSGIDQILKDNKYFFSGLQLDKNGTWQFIYTNLFHQRFQFARMELHDPITKELRNYIEEQYLSLY